MRLKSGTMVWMLWFFLPLLCTSAPSFAQRWEQVDPGEIPTVRMLNDVWVGASISDGRVDLRIFSVGEEGTILSSDGEIWEEQESGTIQDLNGVWGISPENVFAVGNAGVTIHFDGDTWEEQESGPPWDLNDVWGDPTGQAIVAVGDSGTILSFDGDTWVEMGNNNHWDLNGIWGFSPRDIFAVGVNGTILHFDGEAWKEQESGTITIQNLNSVWGTSSDNVYAVGDEGTILRYDGNTWTDASGNLSSIAALNSVWGTSPCNIYAVGESSSLVGTILHFDGSSWSVQDSLVSVFSDSDVIDPLKGIHGASIRNIYAVGKEGFVMSFDPQDDAFPAVCSTSPAHGSEGVAVDADISAVFSAVMDPATVTGDTFTLVAGSDTVEGTVFYSDNTAVFDPDGNLAYATTYTATLSANVKDNLGVPLENDFRWTFTTQNEPTDTDGSCFISVAR